MASFLNSLIADAIRNLRSGDLRRGLQQAESALQVAASTQDRGLAAQAAVLRGFLGYVGVDPEPLPVEHVQDAASWISPPSPLFYLSQYLRIHQLCDSNLEPADLWIAASSLEAVLGEITPGSLTYADLMHALGRANTHLGLDMGPDQLTVASHLLHNHGCIERAFLCDLDLDPERATANELPAEVQAVAQAALRGKDRRRVAACRQALLRRSPPFLLTEDAP